MRRSGPFSLAGPADEHLHRLHEASSRRRRASARRHPLTKRANMDGGRSGRSTRARKGIPVTATVVSTLTARKEVEIRLGGRSRSARAVTQRSSDNPAGFLNHPGTILIYIDNMSDLTYCKLGEPERQTSRLAIWRNKIAALIEGSPTCSRIFAQTASERPPACHATFETNAYGWSSVPRITG